MGVAYVGSDGFIRNFLQASCCRARPGFGVGFRYSVAILRLTAASSKDSTDQIRRSFGFGYNAAALEEILLPLLRLLYRNRTVPTPHDQQTAGLGGPAKSIWAHYF